MRRKQYRVWYFTPFGLGFARRSGRTLDEMKVAMPKFLGNYEWIEEQCADGSWETVDGMVHEKVAAM